MRVDWWVESTEYHLRLFFGNLKIETYKKLALLKSNSPDLTLARIVWLEMSRVYTSIIFAVRKKLT